MRKLFICLTILGKRSKGFFTFCALVTLSSLFLMSCATVMNNLPGVYKLEIQQGNIVDQSMIDQLKPNMNKRQVLYVMGSPMMSDVFNDNQWNYIYSDQPSGGDRVQKRITLYFKDDQLSGFQGDFKPEAQTELKPTGETTVDVPKRDIEKTMWEKITGLVGYDGIDDDDNKKDKSENKTTENNLPL